ncbi:ferrochelatase [Aliikangiella sp. G2MR2-5]|uniref:ferrochelatase n=1 Tax=Aliikangiella sp. G2MR2-5 TaxID=2788943 RepID=UPI0018A90EF8|nr:ferrochelatase [Aliikangiella sp. G2MR2-5]
MKNQKRGILLVNLGTPSEPTPEAVRRFLKAFLSDRRVVDLPRLIWLPILYGIILNFRPAKVAKNYRKIWTENGSPLLVLTKRQQEKLQTALNSLVGSTEFKVVVGMTYLEPSIKQGLDKLAEWGADEVTILPLYPQYSTTTTAPVTDQLELLEKDYSFQMNVIQEYHSHRSYIKALAASARDSIKGKDKLVMSFHGLPKRYVTSGDPYQEQCEKTAELLAKELGLAENQWEVAYQSRVGKEEWLKPYLDERLPEIAAEGTSKIAVICPGFSVDCLETLEEIAMENKALFLENGGEKFDYIPALNDRERHIEMMLSLITKMETV